MTWNSVRVLATALLLAGSPTLAAKASRSTPAPAKPAPSAPAEAFPEMTAEDQAKDAAADAKREEQIDSLKKIIPKLEDGDPNKADLLFQLSELYWERSKFLNRKEMQQFADAETQADAAKARGETAPEPKEDHRESELYRSETMRLYETILRDYPSYERKDEVLFSLGYNLYEIGKKDGAVKRYEELIKQYPSSKFVADTYVQLGNHYFDVANNLLKAREMFEKAYASPAPKIKSYALYKLAWCDYNAGEHEKALRRLEQVVEFAENQQDRKQFTDLKNEALNDMVVMFVALNRADEAAAYFRAHATKKRQTTLISKLADNLAEAGHYENAIRIYRAIVAEDPMQERAPVFQQAIIKSYEGLRQRDQVKAEVKRMAELYRPGSPWWQANASKTQVLRDAFNVSEEAMRTIVTEYHQEAQKTKQVETYRLARDIYKQYVDAFASSDDPGFVSDYAFNLRFYYGEILWTLEEWEAAAHQYDTVVTFKIPDRETAREVSQEKYRQSAAYSAILAYEKLMKIERGQASRSELKEGTKLDEKQKKGAVDKQAKLQKRSAKELEEQPLTNTEQALVAACDRYNQLYPGNKDEIDVRYQAAVVYYDRNHFVDAAKRFGEIIMKWPEEKRSQEAADLSMSVLEEKGEWLELNKLARQFLANKKLTKPGSELAQRVASVLEGSQYKWVDEVIYKKEKNPERAAEEFLKFVQEFPRSEHADRALAYVMVIEQQLPKIDRAIELGERVLKEYPGTPYELKVRYNLATDYEKLTQLQKAAEEYEAFIAAYDRAAAPVRPGRARAAAAARKGDPRERQELVKEAEQWLADAQFNAGLWWEGLGRQDRAIAAYQAYMTRFRDRKDVPDIAYNIALIHEKAKQWPETKNAFEGFEAAYARDPRVPLSQHYQARYHAYLAQLQIHVGAESERMAHDLLVWYPRLPAEDRKMDRVRDAYAHVRFLALEPLWTQYTEIRFNQVSRLKRELALKLRKIQEVEKAYTEVLAIGSGEDGIAALTRIGLAYADFAQNFIDSPNPRGLDSDQLEMYRSELENRAFPLEEKALEALQKALAKSYELNIYSSWTLLAQDKVNKFRPGLYSKVRPVQYQGAELFTTAPLAKEPNAHPDERAALP